MKSVFKVLSLTVGCLLLSSMAFGQWTLFTVEEGAAPGGTTYPTLTEALATAATYPNGPHKIMVMAGDYYDVNLTVVNVDEIYGDPTAAPGDVVFHGASHFLNMASGLSITNMTITGYDHALRGNGVNNCVITNVVFDANNYGVVLFGAGADLNTVEDCLFTNNALYGVYCDALTGGGGANVIQDNCFLGNNGGGVQGYDASTLNVWDRNYWNDDTGVTYALDGGVGAADNNPWRRENQVAGPTTVEVFDPVNVDFNWVAPGCSAGDPVLLAAYEFTVSYDPAKLDYVSAAYDEAYLGGVGAGALYTSIAVDEVAGTITFAATNFDQPGDGDGRLAHVSFEAIGVTAGTIIAVGSQYLDENANPIPAGSQPLTVVITDTEKPSGTVVFDDPIGNMTFSNYYSMVFSGTAHDNYCLSQVYYQVPGYIGWTLIKTLSGTDDVFGPVTVAMGAVPEGTHQIQILFRDCQGSVNDFSLFYTFTVDKTGPDVANLVLADLNGCGATAGYTNADVINVSWDNPDGSAVKYEFYYNKNAGWGIYGPTTGGSPTTFTLNGVEAADHGVWVRQYDEYGNMGPQIGPTNIALDKTAGSPSGLTLDGGAAKTADKTIAVSATAWSVASGSLYYFLTETKSQIACGATGWQPIVPPYVYNFDLQDVEGVHWVFRATMDIAGNVSAIDSATIILDKTPAEFDAFAVADATGSECSDNWTVSVTFASNDPGIKKVHLGQTAGGPYTTVIDISAMTSPYTVPYTLIAGVCDADNTVYGVLEDDIANLSAVEASGSVFVDCAVPTAGTVALNGANWTWTASPVVSVALTGVSADANEILMSKVSGDYSAAVVEDFDAGDPNTTFNFGTPIENTWVYLYVKVEDCADRQSAEVVGGGVAFDLTNPVISVVSINGGAAATNNPVVSVGFTYTELHPQTVYISANADMSAAIVYPWVAGPPYSFTLATGDGVKHVYVQLEDFVGRKSAIMHDDIDLDGTVPVAGAFTITSSNPLAIAGWTSALPGNTWAFVPADADIIWMQIQNADGTGGMTISPFALPAGGTLNPMVDPVAPYPDAAQIRYRLRDDANNTSGWFYAAIQYYPTNPPAPTNASGVPGGSIKLTWDAMPNCQAYQIRYNFTNEHPDYASGPPPFPTSMIQGIQEVAKLGSNTYDFEGPQDDLYAFGIWSLSNAGLWSNTANNQVLENNYRLGDFEDPDEVLGSDGCLSFDPEFVALAVSYNTLISETYYDEYLDFAPTSDGSATGNADPDGAIDFEDLVIFALDYKWSRAQSECDGQKAGGGAAAGLADLTVSAFVPTYARIGDEFTVPVAISEGAGMAGYHFVFDYDKSSLEVVSVNRGQVYDGIDKAFFYHDADAAGIDISSAVLNDEGLAGGEIAVITFRTKVSGPVTFSDKLLDVRDWDNQRAQVSFTLAATGGSLPTVYSLSQNYPNPFNPATKIELAMPAAGQYRLTIYNVIGQVVEVMEGFAEAGYVTLNWDATEQASGVYLYKVTAGDFSATRKMILLK